MDDIRRYQQEHFPPHLRLRFAGLSDITVTTNREIITGQVLSIGLSLVLVLGLLIVIFRSLVKGLLGVVPLLFTIVINFGLMGFLRIPLDIGSAIISSIAIGVGVDYSIHYLARLQLELSQGRAEEAVARFRLSLWTEPESQAGWLALSQALHRNGEVAASAEAARMVFVREEFGDSWLAYHLAFPAKALALLDRLREEVRR